MKKHQIYTMLVLTQTIVSFTILASYNYEPQPILAILFSILTLLYPITSLFFAHFSVKNEHQEIIIQQQNEYIQEINDLTQKLRKQKHDFLNHLSVIQGLANENKLEKLQTYLTHLGANIAITSQILNIKNPYIAYIISEFALKCESKKIEFELLCNSDLSNITIAPIHITNLLGNILNNALENCEKERGFISLDIENTEKYLTINIFNNGPPIEENIDIFKEGYSSKGTGRGFGLKIVSDILCQYDGNIRLEKRDLPTFIVTIPNKEVFENVESHAC